MISNGQTEAGWLRLIPARSQRTVLLSKSRLIFTSTHGDVSHNLEVSLKIMTVSSLNRSQELPRFTVESRQKPQKALSRLSLLFFQIKCSYTPAPPPPPPRDLCRAHEKTNRFRPPRKDYPGGREIASYLSASRGKPLREPSGGGARWSYLPVADVISAGVVDFDDDKHVLEMGSDVFRGERQGPGLLEHDGDDVVADVPLPQQLAEGKKKIEVLKI